VCWGPETIYLPEKKVDFSEKKGPSILWMMINTHIYLLQPSNLSRNMFSYVSPTGLLIKHCRNINMGVQAKRREEVYIEMYA